MATKKDKAARGKAAAAAFNPDDWISHTQAAELRGVSVQAIGQLVRKNDGRIRTMTIGDHPVVHRDDIVNFQPKKPGPAPGTPRRDEART